MQEAEEERITILLLTSFVPWRCLLPTAPTVPLPALKNHWKHFTKDRYTVYRYNLCAYKHSMGTTLNEVAILVFMHPYQIIQLYTYMDIRIAYE